MEPFAPWLVLSNLDDYNQCTLVSAVSVIAIYRIHDFNLVFKLSTCTISTDPCTVVHTNLFPTNCTIHSFDALTCFGRKPQPYLGVYIHTHTHTQNTHHFVGPQILSHNRRTLNLSENTHNMQTKQTNTIQYNKHQIMCIT